MCAHPNGACLNGFCCRSLCRIGAGTADIASFESASSVKSSGCDENDFSLRCDLASSSPSSKNFPRHAHAGRLRRFKYDAVCVANAAPKSISQSLQRLRSVVKSPLLTLVSGIPSSLTLLPFASRLKSFVKNRKAEFAAETLHQQTAAKSSGECVKVFYPRTRQSRPANRENPLSKVTNRNPAHLAKAAR
jgi:hypothetical protein